MKHTPEQLKDLRDASPRDACANTLLGIVNPILAATKEKEAM